MSRRFVGHGTPMALDSAVDIPALGLVLTSGAGTSSQDTHGSLSRGRERFSRCWSAPAFFSLCDSEAVAEWNSAGSPAPVR